MQERNCKLFNVFLKKAFFSGKKAVKPADDVLFSIEKRKKGVTYFCFFIV